MNGHYIRELLKEELFEAARPFLEKMGLLDGNNLEEVADLVMLEHEKYHLLSDIPGRIDFFLKPVVYDPQAVEKILRKPGASDILKGIKPKLEALEPFTASALEELARSFAKDNGVGNGKVFHPLRVSTSGRTQGPSLFTQLEILGKSEVLSRIDQALKQI